MVCEKVLKIMAKEVEILKKSFGSVLLCMTSNSQPWKK